MVAGHYCIINDIGTLSTAAGGLDNVLGVATSIPVIQDILKTGIDVTAFTRSAARGSAFEGRGDECGSEWILFVESLRFVQQVSFLLTTTPKYAIL
jgi:hypothetical protein